MADIAKGAADRPMVHPSAGPAPEEEQAAPREVAGEDVRRIVVGADGSPCSKAALRWALVQAGLTGATVEVVNAWQEPVMLGYTYGAAPVMFEGQDIPAIAEKVLAETVAEAAGQTAKSVEVRSRVVQGHPVQILLQAAAGAQLLVVGSRGHGTFAGILLGSVSQHCVQHAPCPVVVVPQ